MIKKSSEFSAELRPQMKGGPGTAEMTNFVSREELNEKGRMFGKITLNPGCGIGYHVHENESELFYIVRGTADYNDNGEIKTVTAGDVTVCSAGTGHGITNNGDEVVDLIAVIVFA